MPSSGESNMGTISQKPHVRTHVCVCVSFANRDPSFHRKVVYAIDLLGPPASVMELVRARFLSLHSQGATQVRSPLCVALGFCTDTRAVAPIRIARQ